MAQQHRYLVKNTAGIIIGNAIAFTPEDAVAQYVERLNRPSRHFPLGVSPAWDDSELTAEAMGKATATRFDVTSIDAIREFGNGWSWNDAWKRGTLDVPHPVNSRSILNAMREAGHLGEGSKGAVLVERDFSGDCDGFEILQRTNRMPLYHLAPSRIEDDADESEAQSDEAFFL